MIDLMTTYPIETVIVLWGLFFVVAIVHEILDKHS